MNYKRYRVRLPKKIMKQRREQRDFARLNDVIAPWSEEFDFEFRTDDKQPVWLACGLTKSESESLAVLCRDKGFATEIVSNSMFMGLLFDSGVGGTLLSILLLSPTVVLVPVVWMFINDLAWERGALPLGVYFISLAAMYVLSSRMPALIVRKEDRTSR